MTDAFIPHDDFAINPRSRIATSFQPCANEIVTAACNDLHARLQSKAVQDNLGLSEEERRKLAAYRISEWRHEELRKAVSAEFMERTVGMERLFKLARRLGAQEAIRDAVRSHTRSRSQLTPIAYYEAKYQLLMAALGVPESYLAQIDPGLYARLLQDPGWCRRPDVRTHRPMRVRAADDG